jgi:epoxyqueuosine reductase
MDTSFLTKSIKEKAIGLGFDLVGISPAGPFPENQFYKSWLAKGFAGEMNYMEREPEKRGDIKNILLDAKSVISCGMNYNTDYPYSIEIKNKSRGWISRYAWGDDYHYLIKDKLLQLHEYVKDISPYGLNSRVYVDTGPVLERVYGKYSGIGWYGKNTCLINQDIGSWIFIGEIITNLELDYDSPVSDRCGSCTMCIDACPTNALRAPYILDSNLCISYLTIEIKGKIPFEMRDKIDSNIFGCDICQDVCPWNTKAKLSKDESFQPRDSLYNPELSRLSQLSVNEFTKVFKNSPVKRAKRKGLIRNVMVAIGNSANKDFLPYVKEALTDDEPLIRAHAVWALWKLEGNESFDTLSKHFNVETDNSVREEIESILVKNGS